ncbi:MAG: hypothetical protein GMKNLPBB_00498 [Myxococcota bacterium]|nr:hypothetical protein [Myxococcota bacterium]
MNCSCANKSPFVRAAGLAALLIAGLAASAARAEVIQGVVLDDFHRRPVPLATVVLEQTGEVRVTNPAGGFRFEIPPGVYSLHIAGPGIEPMRFVRQVAERSPAEPVSYRMIPSAWSPEFTPPEDAFGVPLRSRLDATPSYPIAIGKERDFSPSLFTRIPSAKLPEKIRVGRRMAVSCANNPVKRIDEVEFESYVKGVVNAEIGVFRSVKGGPAAAMDSFRTFAIAARSYAYWFYLRDPNAPYHIDDTACNQRYEDARSAPIDQAVDEVRGVIMVDKANTSNIEKYEYAASCGRNGTKPEHSTAIIPDKTSVRACVGNWCGHDNCAAHEDNPNIPGTDKCLVRGICQWGSVERSMNGESHTQIIAHYEPNLALRDMSGTPPPADAGIPDTGPADTGPADMGAPDSGPADAGPPADAGDDAGTADTNSAGDTGPDGGGGPPPATGNLVGFVRENDIRGGKNISGASVALGAGLTAVTDSKGYFEFLDVPAGSYELVVDAGNYIRSVSQVRVEAGKTTWNSVALLPDSPPPDAGGEDAAAEDTGAEEDASSPPDAGPADAGAPDRAVEDSGPRDAGPLADAGAGDAANDSGAAPADSGAGNLPPRVSSDGGPIVLEPRPDQDCRCDPRPAERSGAGPVFWLAAVLVMALRRRWRRH